jgi:hypothetical protein
MQLMDEDVMKGRTVGNVAPEVSANDDVPGRTVALVKLLLDLRRDVLLDVVFLESSRGDVHALLLHLLAHVGVLDDHFGSRAASGTCCTAYACIGGSGRCVNFFGH